MQILRIFGKKRRKIPSVVDSFQDALNRTGREQFRRLVEKGLKVPIVVL